MEKQKNLFKNKFVKGCAKARPFFVRFRVFERWILCITGTLKPYCVKMPQENLSVAGAKIETML